MTWTVQPYGQRLETRPGRNRSLPPVPESERSNCSKGSKGEISVPIFGTDSALSWGAATALGVRFKAGARGRLSGV